MNAPHQPARSGPKIQLFHTFGHLIGYESHWFCDSGGS